MKKILSLKRLKENVRQGKNPEYAHAAFQYITEIPEDRCFVSTGLVDGCYFPIFMICLSEAKAKWCGVKRETVQQAGFMLSAVSTAERKDFVTEVTIIFPGGRYLHLPLDTTHPHVVHAMELLLEGSVFAFHYATEPEGASVAAFNVVEADQIRFLQANLQRAKAKRGPNPTEMVVAEREMHFADEHKHRFVRFADSRNPKLLRENGQAFNPDAIEYTKDSRWNFAWSKETDGITLTTEYTPGRPQNMAQQIKGLADSAGDINSTAQKLELLLQDHPGHPTLLTSLHQIYFRYVSRQSADKITARMARHRGESSTHELAYLNSISDDTVFQLEVSRLPQPLDIKNLSPDTTGRYHFTDFLVHECIAARFALTEVNENMVEPVLRLDRLIRTGYARDEVEGPLRAIIEHHFQNAISADDRRAFPGGGDQALVAGLDLHPSTAMWLMDVKKDMLAESLDLVRKRKASTLKNTARLGRNDPCPCGSGKKYKKCCIER